MISDTLWPWLWLAAPLPWLIRRMLPVRRREVSAALRFPLLQEAQAVLASAPRRAGSRAPIWAWLAWLLLVAAATRPVHLGEATDLPTSGRDLLLAVDVSGSMAADDMLIGGRRVDRLSAVKVVLGDFIERRVGDRLGLILFGQQAYLMTPLTFDRRSVRYQLETSAIGLAGRETAIGDAIGLASKRLKDRPQQQRVLILLTDGVNTAGELVPMKAAELASDLGVRVYTIAMGSDQTQQQSMLGMMLTAPPPEIDEVTLKAVADTTGGRFYRARDTAELAQIYAELDRLEPAAAPGQALSPQTELFLYPLLAALMLVLLGQSWRSRAREAA